MNIIVLGGSYGGISSAHYILKHVLPGLPKPNSYRVIIISSSSQALCRPACPRALLSDDLFPQDKLFVDIKKQFEQYQEDSFKFVKGTATMVDHMNRTVTYKPATGESEVLPFYALVLATGASTPSPLLGLNADEKALRGSWEDVRKVLPSAKSIVISGGGPAGVEVAGELGEHLNGRAGWGAPKLDNPHVSITLVTSGTGILSALRPSIQKSAEQYLAKVGVTLLSKTSVLSVSPIEGGGADASSGSKVTVRLSNGSSLEADLYIPATGTKPNTSFLSPSLLQNDGRISTNPATLRVEVAGSFIYAIGDASSYARPAVHNILSAVPVLGTNIKRDLRLDAGLPESEVGPDKNFAEDTRETQLVPIGKSKGVGAAMGWLLPSWVVWLIKGRDYWLWTTGKLWSGQQWAKEG